MLREKDKNTIIQYNTKIQCTLKANNDMLLFVYSQKWPLSSSSNFPTKLITFGFCSNQRFAW